MPMGRTQAKKSTRLDVWLRNGSDRLLGNHGLAGEVKWRLDMSTTPLYDPGWRVITRRHQVDKGQQIDKDRC